jgi:hypothetical protein
LRKSEKEYTKIKVMGERKIMRVVGAEKSNVRLRKREKGRTLHS